MAISTITTSSLNPSGISPNITTYTTATRPASGTTGQLGYNTTTGQLEIYNTIGGWVNAGTAGNTYSVDYLIVAGGGAGGFDRAGGGGAG